MQEVDPSELKSAADLALRVFVPAADKGFRAMDTFTAWFVGGTAAFVGLLISNLDGVSPFISPDEIRAVVVRLVVSALLVLVSKFLGSLICTKAGALEAATEALELWEKKKWNIPDEKAFKIVVVSAMPWPLRWRFRHGFPGSEKQLGATFWLLMVAGLCSILSALILCTVWLELGLAL